MTTPEATSAVATATFFAENLASRVMVILRGLGESRTLRLCEQAWACGVGLVEIPVQSEDDLAALAAAVRAADGRPVGAGTVVTANLVERVADAGAVFTVAPCTDADVAGASLRRGLPHLPGVATPGDIHMALKLGLTWQKAFPASVLGADWMRAVKAPFPDVRLVATGGVDTVNAREFLAAGCDAVALGSSFADAPPASVTTLAADRGHY